MNKIVHRTTVPDAAFVRLHPMLVWAFILRGIQEVGHILIQNDQTAIQSRIIIFIETEAKSNEDQ